MKIKKINIFCFILVFYSIVFSQNDSVKLSSMINYVSAENVYLKSGKASGIQVGDKFTVFRNEQVIGHIEVVYVAQNSASCKILDKTKSFENKDIVIRTYTISVKEAIDDKIIEKRKRKFLQSRKPIQSSPPFARISGSISLQWYQYHDLNESNLSFSQPSLRLNLKARQLWGENYSFYVKIRSRHNNRASKYSNSQLNDKLINRIYTLGFEFSDQQALFNYKFGRIISTKFSGIGYFDGAMLQYNASSNLKFGVFAGNQPQWQYSDFQTSKQKYGFFVNYLHGDYKKSRFESTVAAAGEYHKGIISREFVYIQNRYNSSNKWHLYQSISLDVNRGWRKDISDESVTISNLYLSGRYKFSKMFTAGISFDNRKNYLTYEIKSIVEELFDNASRQGLKTNVILTFPNKIRFSANFGLRKKQDESETTYSYYSSISKSDLIFKNLRGSLRFSGFSNLYTNGYNPSLRITQYLNNGHSFGIKGGSYLYSLNESGNQRSNNWAGFESYIYLFKNIFLLANYEFNWGDDSEGHRILTELGYRF